MRKLPPLSSLRAFEAAARFGSFRRAAEELRVTPTAVSHQIRNLEEHVGVRLFDRRTRQVVLTASGRPLFLVLRDGFDAFAEEVGRLRAGQRRPVVTISATTAFTTKWLVPRIVRFQAAHPDIDLRLHASDAVVDLHGGQVDLAIRYGRGDYPGLASSRLAEDIYAPVVNPALGVVGIGDLARVPLIHFDWQRADAANPTWETWLERTGVDAGDGAALRFSDESNAVQAAVAGQGVALLSLLLVADDLDAGHLVQPFGPTLPGFAYHAVMLPGRREDPSVGWVRKWLEAEINLVPLDCRGVS